MKKTELDRLIQSEVQKQLKLIVPKLVKPLVQEAVAGALAGLLAEGIVNSPPPRQVQSVAHIQNKVVQPKPAVRQSDPETVRNNLRSQMRQLQETPTPINPNVFGGGAIGNLLAETAGDMIGETSTESLLDNVGQLNGVVNEELVDALSRDYSALMQKLNKPRGSL